MTRSQRKDATLAGIMLAVALCMSYVHGGMGMTIYTFIAMCAGLLMLYVQDATR